MAGPDPSQPSTLYEACLVYVVPPTGKLSPELAWQHPSDFEAVWKSQLPLFCFPYHPDSSAALRKQSFMIRFTNELGRPVFGYCLQNEPATPASDAVLLCLVSTLPWFDFFHVALLSINAAYIKAKRDSSVLEACLRQLSQALRSTDLDRPLGNELLLKLPGNVQTTLRVPNARLNPLMSEMQTVGALARCLSWSNLCQLLASIMAERRVVITSEDLGRLSKGCFACDLALFPLHWQQVFIPILPDHLLDYCSAPVPYVVGVHKSLMPSVAERAMEEHVWVDLDTDTVTSPFNDADIVPPELVFGLKEAAKRVRGLGEHAAERAPPVKDFCNLLTRILVELLAGYKQHIETADGLVRFDAEGLLITKPKTYSYILNTIIQTQMFQQFIEAVEKSADVTEGGYFTEADNCRLFDTLVHRYQRLSGDVTQATTKRGRLVSSLRRIKTKVKGGKDTKSSDLTRSSEHAHSEGRGRVQSVVPATATTTGRRRAGTRTKSTKSKLEPSRAPPPRPATSAATALAQLDTSALLNEASTERYRSMSRRLADLGEITDMSSAKATLRNMAAALHDVEATGPVTRRSRPDHLKVEGHRGLTPAAASTSAMDHMPGAGPAKSDAVSSSNPFLNQTDGKRASANDSSNPFQMAASFDSAPSLSVDAEVRRRRSESNPNHPRPSSTSPVLSSSADTRLERAQSDSTDPTAAAIVTTGTLQAKRTSWSASEDSISTAAETDDDGLELTLQPSTPALTPARPPSHRNILSPALEVPTPTGSTGHSRSNSTDLHDRTQGSAVDDGGAADALQSMSLDIVVNDDGTAASPSFLRRAKKGNSHLDVNARFVPNRDSMYLDDMDVTAMLAAEDAAVKAEAAATSHEGHAASQGDALIADGVVAMNNEGSPA
eukprot:m.291111 g.291111  ORF g.291111 m.291111 type:complete len:893 (-) comp17812_c0_seq4:1881-4559(-)